jgi:hypothetical protein
MHSTVNGMYGRLRVPRRKRIPRLSLSDASNRRSVEALVMQAYFQLIRVAWRESGSRSTLLANYGSYEVRLVERKPADGVDVPHLWVELHAKDGKTPIEARGCDDLETAAVVAEQIMARAERLQNEALSRPGKGRG